MNTSEIFTLTANGKKFEVCLDRHDALTVCTIVSNLHGVVAKTGTALRNPQDIPDRNIGDRTAFKRAAGNLDFHLFIEDPEHAPELYKLLWRAYRIYRKGEPENTYQPTTYSALPLAADTQAFRVGDRVMHEIYPEWGIGTVLKVEADKVWYHVQYESKPKLNPWITKVGNMTLITEPAAEVEQ